MFIQKLVMDYSIPTTTVSVLDSSYTTRNKNRQGHRFHGTQTPIKPITCIKLIIFKAVKIK